MVVRKYEEKDWERIKEIHDEARKIELCAAGLEEAYLTLEQTYQNEGLFDYQLLVEENENKSVVGFIAFHTDEIGWLYVDPVYHRLGVGTRLLEAAMRKTGNEVLIEVLENNTGAIALYEKYGFKKTEKVRGVMPGNERFKVVVEGLKYNKDTKK